MCKIKKIAGVATQNEVEGMSTEQLQETLLRVVELQPGVSMDIFKPAEQQPGGYHPALGGSAPDWCMCGRCREMPTDIEKKCCQKQKCISEPVVSIIYIKISYLIH